MEQTWLPKNMPDCIFTRMSKDATVALLNLHSCDEALTWKQVQKVLFLDNATVARAKLIVDKLSLVLRPSPGEAITDEHYQAYLLLGACQTAINKEAKKTRPRSRCVQHHREEAQDDYFSLHAKLRVQRFSIASAFQGEVSCSCHWRTLREL